MLVINSCLFIIVYLLMIAYLFIIVCLFIIVYVLVTDCCLLIIISLWMIVCLLIILFADYYLLTFKRQICHAFSEREQVQLQRAYVSAHDGFLE